MDSSTSTIPDGKVKVAVRIRPLSQREIEGGCQRCITINPDSSSITLGGRTIEGGRGGRGTAPRSFTFNSVYDEHTTQETIYKDIAAPLVTSFLNGYNGTIFAYGQTGSGKTHTMGSAVTSSDTFITTSVSTTNGTNHSNDTNGSSMQTMGIIPRVAKDIFDYKNTILASSVSASSASSFSSSSSSSSTSTTVEVTDTITRSSSVMNTVDSVSSSSSLSSTVSPPLPPHRLTASFIEIYNEKIRDLLAPLPPSSNHDNGSESLANDGEENHGTTALTTETTNTAATVSHRMNHSHPPRTDRFGNVMPDGVTEREIHHLSDIYTLLAEGARRRATETTKMNAVSSRSHAILTFKLEIFEQGTDLQTVRTARGDCPTYSLSSSSVNGTTTSSTSSSTTAHTVSDEQQRLMNIGLGQNYNQPTYAKLPGPQPVKTSLFRLVDLAGSERLSQTQATGQRATEGKNINLSLLTLTKVITALSEAAEQKALVQQQQQQQQQENVPPQQKRSKTNNNNNNSSSSSTIVTTHIPFRESRLTQLLTNSLGGNSQTVFIACASPADENHDQTRSTLEYAASAAKIKNKPTLSIDPNVVATQLLKDNLTLATNELIRLHHEGIVLSPHILTTLSITAGSTPVALPMLTDTPSVHTLSSTAHVSSSLTGLPPPSVPLSLSVASKEYYDNRILSLTNELTRANATVHAVQTSELKLRHDLTKLVESARLLHAQLEAQQSILGKLQDDYDTIYQDRTVWRNKTEYLQNQITHLFQSKGYDDTETVTLTRDEIQAFVSSLGSSTVSVSSTASAVPSTSNSILIQELTDEVLDLRRKADESNVALAVMEAAQRIHSETNTLRKAGIVSSNTLTRTKSKTVPSSTSSSSLSSFATLSSKPNSPSSSSVKDRTRAGQKRERSVDQPCSSSDDSDTDDHASVGTGGRRSFSPVHVVHNEHDLDFTHHPESIGSSSSSDGTNHLIDLPTDDEILAALEHNATVRSLQHTANDLAANIRAETQREDDILQRYHALIGSSSKTPSGVPSSSTVLSSSTVNDTMDDENISSSSTPLVSITPSSSSASSATASLSTASAILASMEAQHAAALADADAASQRMHDLMNDLHTRGIHIDRLQMELRMVQDEAELAEKEHAAELAELRQALSTNSAHPMKHHSRVAAAQARVMNAKARQDHTEKQLATLRAEVTSLTLDKQRLQRTVDEAKARAKEFDRLRADLETSNRAKVKLAHQVEDNARKLRQAKEEARTHAALEQRARAEDGKERASLRNQVDTLLRLVGRLESEVANYKTNQSNQQQQQQHHQRNHPSRNPTKTNGKTNGVSKAIASIVPSSAVDKSGLSHTTTNDPSNVTTRNESSVPDDDNIPFAFANDESTTNTTTTIQGTKTRNGSKTTESTNATTTMLPPPNKLRRGHSSLVPGAISGAARQAVLKTLGRNDHTVTNQSSENDDSLMDQENLFDVPSVHSSTANHKYQRTNLIEARQASAVAASSALIAEALSTIVAAMNKREDTVMHPADTTTTSTVIASSSTATVSSSSMAPSVPVNDEDGGFAALLGLSGDTLVDESEAITFEGPDDLPYQRTVTATINPHHHTNSVSCSSSTTTAIAGPFGGAGTATARARAEEASARRLAGARRAAATIARVVYLNVNRNHMRTLRATAIAERRTLTNALNSLQKKTSVPTSDNDTNSSSNSNDTSIDTTNHRIQRLSNRIATLNHRLQEIDDITRREGLDGNKWVTRVLQAHAPINPSATGTLSNVWMQADKIANIRQYSKGILTNISNGTNSRANGSNYSTQHLINDPYMRSTWITAPRPEALLPWLISIIARQSSKLKMLQAALRVVALREKNGGVTATALLQATVPSSIPLTISRTPTVTPHVPATIQHSSSSTATTITTSATIGTNDAVTMSSGDGYDAVMTESSSMNTAKVDNHNDEDEEDTMMDDSITDFHPIGNTTSTTTVETSLLLPFLVRGPDNYVLPTETSLPSNTATSSISSAVMNNTTTTLPSVPSFAVVVQDEGDDVWGNSISSSSASESRRNSAEYGIELSSSSSGNHTVNETSMAKLSAKNSNSIEVDEDGFVISSTDNGNSTHGFGFGTTTVMNTNTNTLGGASNHSKPLSIVPAVTSTRQSVIFHSTKTMKAVNAPHARHTTTNRTHTTTTTAPTSTAVVVPPPSLPTDNNNASLRPTSRGRQSTTLSTVPNDTLQTTGSILSTTSHRRSNPTHVTKSGNENSANIPPSRRSSVTKDSNNNNQQQRSILSETTDITNNTVTNNENTNTAGTKLNSTTMMMMTTDTIDNSTSTANSTTIVRTSIGSHNGKDDTTSNGAVVRARRPRAGSNGRTSTKGV